MKILSVFGSAKFVMRRLENYLLEHRFNPIRVDYNSREIDAERTLLFFRKDILKLKITSAKDDIATIELEVNPTRDGNKPSVAAKESKILGEIYGYF